MVIVSIYGGLGNQMFQYAFGRSLATRLDTDLKYDYSFNLRRKDFKQSDIVFLLDIFKLKIEHATIEEIRKFRVDNKVYRKAYIYLKNLIPSSIIRNKLIYESTYDFHKSILSSDYNYYVSGYWQSEKYFKDIISILKEEFKLQRPADLRNVDITEKIENSESVSVHLRGRDYIANPATKKMHFTCNLSYYERSFYYLTKVLKKNIHFFVFSDDHNWARSFLQTEYPFTIVEGNSWNKGSYEDLRLMSLCKHNIIANSSFSWWGAWLNQNPHKIVVAPQKWFNDPKLNIQSADIVPSNWIRL